MKVFGIDFGPIKPKRPRSPMRYLRDASLGYPLFPLVTLFGLNAVDELDRAAFGILLPEIRDHFGLDLGTNKSCLLAGTPPDAIASATPSRSRRSTPSIRVASPPICDCSPDATLES